MMIMQRKEKQESQAAAATVATVDQLWQNASPVDSGLQACTHPKCSLRKQRGRASGSSGDPVRLDLRGEASNAATTK